jgi:hypothetical protein
MKLLFASCRSPDDRALFSGLDFGTLVTVYHAHPEMGLRLLSDLELAALSTLTSLPMPQTMDAMALVLRSPVTDAEAWHHRSLLLMALAGTFVFVADKPLILPQLQQLTMARILGCDVIAVLTSREAELDAGILNQADIILPVRGNASATELLLATLRHGDPQ